MNIWVTVDSNWAIGNGEQLLIRIPRDHKLLLEETAGKVVVLGRKALQTMPQGLPMQGRTNIILSGNKGLQVKGATVVHSLEELMKELKNYSSEDIYVIGGESVYAQLLPYCEAVYVTKMDHTYAANKYFPNLDKSSEWRLVEDSDEQTYFDIAYEFLKYERVKKDGL